MSLHSSEYKLVQQGHYHRIFVGIFIVSALLFGMFSVSYALANEGEGDTGNSGDSTVVEGQNEEPVEEPIDNTSNNDGSDGSDGTTGDEEVDDTSGEGGEAFVETGNAVSEGNVENTSNTSVTDTDGQNDANNDNSATTTPDTLGDDDTASTTPDVLGDEGENHSPAPSPSSITVDNTSDADAASDLSVDAGTGDNDAQSSGDATVLSGHALASANVLNIINTNIFNSDGLLLFLNLLFSGETFDLRDLGLLDLFGGSSGSSSCSLQSCGGGVDITVDNSSTATIVNNVIVRSSTGGNTATSTDGSALIQTGDAYASANVVNIVNTNLVNTNYLLLAVNNFGDFMGDIVLPGKDFFTQFFSHFGNGSGGSGSTSIDVSNASDASLENNVSVDSETGGNDASGGGDAVITTGDANSGANIVNQVNTNLFGADSLLILFRVYGNWTGNVFGLPDGILWSETPYGIQFLSAIDGPSYDTGSASTLGGSSLNVSNNSTSSITNNIDVYALTGENKANAGGGSATIDTGDAYASANLINIANTNVVGRNWILAIFNIFGDFSGDISFGRPDLWIGARAHSSHNPLTRSSHITYSFTITNLGDSDATGVTLKNLFNSNHLSFSGYDLEFGDIGGIGWNIGVVPAGESVEVSYGATVSANIPYGQTPIVTTTTVESIETDEDTSNNTEELTLLAMVSDDRLDPKYSGAHIRYTPDADLKITKISDAKGPIVASSTVDYTITIVNEGGIAYYSVLSDVLVDKFGEVVNEQSWGLGEIYPDEEIQLTYTAIFNEDALPGFYTNYAQVKAIDRNPSINPFYGDLANSLIASSTIEIEGSELEETYTVTVSQSAPGCGQYLTGFIKPEENNDPNEVTKLQAFLKDFEGFTTFEINGDYNLRSAGAVRIFQNRYKEDILEPWGLTEPTGYVYLTTRKKINELYCGGTEAFSLTGEEQTEIGSFRTLFESLDGVDEENFPPASEVGIEETTDALAVEEVPAVHEEELDAEDNTPSAIRGRAFTASVVDVAESASSVVEKVIMNTIKQITSWISDRYENAVRSGEDVTLGN